MKHFATTFVGSLGTALFLLQANACSSTSTSTSTKGEDDHPHAASQDGGAAGDGRQRLSAPIHPDASCEVEIASPEVHGATHVAIGTDITYSSNPPSGGDHYPEWAAFQEFATVVPRPYWVHDLEHGAVVLLHRCTEGAECDGIVAGLRAVADQVPSDPRCPAGGPRVRIVITPDPLLDVPVAAAAWGWTYRAQCVDAPTLLKFVRDNYALGPEDTCANGKSAF